MPEDVYVQHIRGSITESAAATLTMAEILTGASVAGMIRERAVALEVRQVVTAISIASIEDLPTTGTVEEVGFALSVQSGLTALPVLSDVHCIYKRALQIRSGVGTYLPLIVYEAAFPPVHDFEDPLLIPHPKIYAYIKSTNSSAAAGARFQIGFTYVELAGVEALEALEVWRSPTA